MVFFSPSFNVWKKIMKLQTYANKIDPFRSVIYIKLTLKKTEEWWSIFFAQILNFFLSSNFAATDK